MSAPIPEVRISPSGHHVAARDGNTRMWLATNGFTCTDEQVADWTPLIPATALVAELKRDVSWLQAWGWREAADMLRERIVELREILRGAA